MATATQDPPAKTNDDELDKKRQEAKGVEAKAKEPLEGEGAGEKKADEPADEPALVISGAGQLSLEVGGKEPDEASVALRGGAITIPKGQYEKGAYANLMIKVRCAEVHLIDKIDNSTGEIVGTERKHVFKIVDVEKV